MGAFGNVMWHVLIQVLIVVFLVVAVAGLGVGVGLIFSSQKTSDVFRQLNRWFSTRHALKTVEVSRETDAVAHRYQRWLAGGLVLGGLVAIFGLLAFAVDYGRFYAIQAELQTAADAAALAAGTKLIGTTSSTDQANTQWNASFDSTTGNDNRFNLRLNQILFSANLLAQTNAGYFSGLSEANGNTGSGETASMTCGQSTRLPISPV